SINQLTPYETNTRMAYQDVQVAQADPIAPAPAPRPDALAGIAADAPMPPADLPFQLLGYGAELNADPVQEPTGTPIRMALGAVDGEAAAQDIATHLALLGAVETTTVIQGDQTVTHLMLSHLREGVTETDALDLAA